MKNILLTCFSFYVLLIFSSCRKFTELKPPRTQIATSTVYGNDATAISAISGIYVTMSTSSTFAGGGSTSMTFMAGLSSDEFRNTSNNNLRLQFALNSLSPENTILTSNLWGSLYQYIFYANSVLEGLANSTDVTTPVKNQLTGEAKFIRAFSHFYLVNLFGNVPLVKGTDYRFNSVLQRTPVVQVYDQIVADLKEAQQLLADNYTFANTNRVRPCKWAATALLARVYLYRGDWSSAEAESTSIINNTALFELLPNLNSVFLKNSREAIWQLIAAPPNNTNEASVFQTFQTFGALAQPLVDSFETGDLRRTNWVIPRVSGSTTYYCPYKYKVSAANQPITEHSMVLRFAEQLLIRAEARANNNNIPGGLADLNLIRQRSGLAPLNLNSTSDLLVAIEKERNMELFSEWGHRWLDLKRTNRVDALLSAVKAGWQSTDALYPIPKTERDKNPNLTQNPGY